MALITQNAPLWIYTADNTLLLFAGLFEAWQFQPGEWQTTFTILTTSANRLLQPIHNRMPVILPPETYDRWLSTVEPDPRDLLVPFPADLMMMWPISTRVNKPDNDEPEILEPFEPITGSSPNLL